MATITTRAGKGSPLTNTEVDDNFSNLNSAKYESGSSPVFGVINIESTTGTAERYISVGSSAIDTSAYSYIDFIGDTTYTDYGLRLMRGNSGENTNSSLQHRGTGNFYFDLADGSNSVIFNENSRDTDFRVESNDNANMLFVDASTNTVVIGNSGSAVDSQHLAVHGNTGLGNRLTSSSNGGYVTEISGKSLTTDGSDWYGSYGVLNFYATSSYTGSARRWTLTNGHRTNRFAFLVGDTDSSSQPELDGNGGQASNAFSPLWFNSETGGATFNDDSKDADFRVESNSNSHMLFVDGGNDTVVMGSSSSPLVNGSSTRTYDLVLDKGVAIGNSPYTHGYIGTDGTDGNVVIAANSYSANLGATRYVKIMGGTAGGGGPASIAEFNGDTGAVFNEGGLDRDFRVESDDLSHCFFVDASENGVGIGDGGVLPNGLKLSSITANTNDIDTKLYINGRSSGTTTQGFGVGITFAGDRNGDGATQQMAKINARSEANSGTTLSSALDFQTATAGVNTTKMTIQNDGAVVIKPNGITTGLRLQGRSSDDNFYIQYKSNDGSATYASIGTDSANTGLMYNTDVHKFNSESSANNFATFSDSSITFNIATVDRDFLVSSDNVGYMFYIDGGNDAIGVGRHTALRDIATFTRANTDDSFGTTTAAIEVTNANNQVGHFSALNFRVAAGNYSESLATVSAKYSNYSGNVMGQLSFGTRAASSTNVSERMRIDEYGTSSFYGNVAVMSNNASNAFTVSTDHSGNPTALQIGGSGAINGVSSANQSFTILNVAKDSGSGKSAYFHGHVKTDGVFGSTRTSSLGSESVMNLLNHDPENGGTDFDQAPTNNSDGGGTSWSMAGDGNSIYYSSTSGGHGGIWMYIHAPAGYYVIKGSVRLTNTDGAIHPSTNSANYKYTHSFQFFIDSGPNTGALKWDADGARAATGTDFVRAAFCSSPIYMADGYRAVKYATNGYDGVQRIYITDLQLVRVS